MQAILLAILKQVGTTLLLGFLEEATTELKDRPDNQINDDDVTRVRGVIDEVRAARAAKAGYGATDRR